MHVAELLLKLKDNKIDIDLLGENIEIRYDFEKLPEPIYREIAENKHAIVSYLKKLRDQTGSRTGTTSTIDDHLVLLQPGKVDLTIFVIPGKEGAVPHFKEATKRSENCPAIYGIQMMGLKDGERPLTNINEIARQNITWIKRLQSGGPYRLIGFSFGGLVVYEMIRQLESTGDQVDYAAILDVSATPAAVVDYAETLAGLGCQILEKMGVVKMPYPGWILNLKEVLSSMTREEAVDYMVGFLREKSGYFAGDSSFWARMLEVLFTNVLAVGPVSGKIDEGVTVVRAADENWDGADHDLGWSKHASHVEVFTVPGTHDQVLHNSLDKILEHIDHKFQLKDLK